jgi:hypothetical protein
MTVKIRINTGTAVFDYVAIGNPADLESAALELHGVCSVTTIILG